MRKNIAQGFDTFLEKLSPLKSEHDSAASHKNSVKRCLENNFGCYQFNETGSFGNGTGVRHYSDIDYFASCPKDQISKNSAIALRNTKGAFEITFWQTPSIEVRTPSVRINFGKFASEILEVTPSRFIGMIDTQFGKKRLYDIPGYDGDWMQSSPEAHNSYVKNINDRFQGKLKPLIQLVKAWKFYNSAPINSFYLELRVTKYAEGRRVLNYEVDVRNVMKAIYDNGLASIQDPMNISGLVRACNSEAKRDDALSRLGTGFSRAEKAYEQGHKNLDKAFHWWNMFYSERFPSR